MSTTIDVQQRYQQLKDALARVGYFRRGTLLKRFMICGKPACVCKSSPPRLHGPYYQWTRSIGGKTVTVFFTRQQADLVASWIAESRKLNRIIAQMERLSLRATESLLKELPSSPRKAPTRRARGKPAPRSQELPDRLYLWQAGLKRRACIRDH